MIAVGVVAMGKEKEVGVKPANTPINDVKICFIINNIAASPRLKAQEFETDFGEAEKTTAGELLGFAQRGFNLIGGWAAE